MLQAIMDETVGRQNGRRIISKQQIAVIRAYNADCRCWQ